MTAATSNSFALIFQELVEEYGVAKESQGILVIVADCWLYRLFKEHYRENTEVKFLSPIAWVSVMRKVQYLARGLVARIRLLARMIRQMVIVKRKLNGRQTAKHKDAHNIHAWIYSNIEPRLFQGRDQIDDPYMPGLCEMLQRNRVSVQRLIGLMFPPPYEGRQSALSSGVVPLLDRLQLRDVWDAVTCCFGVRGLVPFDEYGTNMHQLIEREKWEEIRSANLALNVLYYHAFRRFFESHRGKCLFFFYEGQAWEKMLCLAKRASGTTMKLVGYQHSTIPLLLLNYFPHSREWDYLPHPDSVLANGSFHKKIMKDAGYPERILKEGGTLRYQQFERGRAHVKSKSDRSTESSIIFVALPTSPFISRELIELLIQHNDVWVSQGIYFWIKPHPDCPLEQIGRYSEREKHFETVTRTLTEIIGEIDAVLYSSTTVGLEALLLGLPVLAYVPEMAISCDPVLDWFPECVITCDSEDFLERILGCVQGRISARGDAPNAEMLFGKVEESVWVAIVDNENNYKGNGANADANN